MAEILTYEELEQRVRELEEEVVECKRAEEESKVQKSRFHTIVDSVGSGIDIVSYDYKVQFQNKFLLDRFGDIRGKLCYKEYMNRDKPCSDCAMRRAIENNKVERTKLIGQDGRSYELISAPIKNPDGTISAVEVVTDISELKRAEEMLRYRVEFQRLIATLSTNFINLATDEIDHEINRALQKIGELADVDRSYVFLFDDNVTKMDNTHEWCAEGIEPQIQNNQGFLVKDFPWCEERIKRFETIHIPRVADLPPEAIEKEVFQAQQIQSLILVPMLYDKSLYGFIGFDSVGTEKIWSEDMISLLRIVGEIFANALERKRAEDALRKTHAELDRRVEERSAELAARNKQLELEIIERKRLEDSLLKSERRLRTLSSRLLAVQEQERKKISQELHDDLGQILTAVLLDITQAKKLEIPVASSISSFLDRIQAGSEEALQRVRSLSATLRPRVLDHLGLEAAVASFLEDFRERTGLTVVEEIHVGHNDIPEPLTIAIYRILQEATTNIVKHAAANQIIVQLYSDQHTVALSVTDDGQGFDPQSLPTDQGLGIMGMRERTGQLGGAFRIVSAPVSGTTIYVEIPLLPGI